MCITKVTWPMLFTEIIAFCSGSRTNPSRFLRSFGSGQGQVAGSGERGFAFTDSIKEGLRIALRSSRLSPFEDRLLVGVGNLTFGLGKNRVKSDV